MLVKNSNLWLNMFLYVHLLVYHKIIKHSVHLVRHDL